MQARKHDVEDGTHGTGLCRAAACGARVRTAMRSRAAFAPRRHTTDRANERPVVARRQTIFIAVDRGSGRSPTRAACQRWGRPCDASASRVDAFERRPASRVDAGFSARGGVSMRRRGRPVRARATRRSTARGRRAPTRSHRPTPPARLPVGWIESQYKNWSMLAPFGPHAAVVAAENGVLVKQRSVVSVKPSAAAFASSELLKRRGRTVSGSVPIGSISAFEAGARGTRRMPG